ncbi:glycosyltransferase family 2 protein [Pontibacter populi]|uniref:Glycosyltransferase family 2 protein n=1 Tax=Pontibacter populi TaxID=890055 RepID=A0ABV1RVA3_9BACT
MLRAAAIIVCYNGEKYIEECLNTLILDKSITNIIVVDNNSKDNSISIIKNKFPEVTVIALDKNVGFGQANNLGIEIGLKEDCNFFFLLNQDAYCQPNCVSRLIEINERNKDYGIVAPVQLNGKGDRVDVKFYNYLFSQNEELAYDLIRKNIKDIYKVNFVNAAAWLISKECILKIGGFDPVFFHTGEDDDYVQRVKYCGYKIGIAPNINVRHDRPQLNWSHSSTDKRRQITLNILKLKNIDKPVMYNVYKLIKKNIYYIGYDLIKMRFKSAMIKFLSLINTLGMFPIIVKSRKESFADFAFLKYQSVCQAAD